MSIRQKLFGKSGFVFGYFTIRQRLRKHIRFFCFLRRHPMLIDDTERGLGKRNTLKCGTVIWRCNFRPKINSCPGLVAQSGNKFEKPIRQMDFLPNRPTLPSLEHTSTAISFLLIYFVLVKNPTRVLEGGITFSSNFSAFSTRISKN